MWETGKVLQSFGVDEDSYMGVLVYSDHLDVAKSFITYIMDGEYSVETATIYLKLGNYYMRMEEERSFDKAKHWLHKAFNSRLN